MSQKEQPAMRQSLERILGSKNVSWESEAAAACPLRPAPWALARAADVTQVAACVKLARQAQWPLVAYGAGSRLRARRKLRQGAYLALSMSGLAGVERLQADSLWLKARSGTSLSEIVGRAAREGLRPVGFNNSSRGSLGGWLAAHSRVPDAILGLCQPAVLGLEAVDPWGNFIASVTSPRAATGSDWFSLMQGTDGAFGVITAATIKLEPIPERRLVTGFRFRNLATALVLLRRVMQKGWPPAEVGLLLQNQPSRQVRLWLRYEGMARMAAQAIRWSQEQAEAMHAKAVALDKVREWQAESPAAAAQVLSGPVRYSRLHDVLAAVSEWEGGFVRASLDRVDSSGGRLRVELDRRADATARLAWDEIWDPGAEMRARANLAERRLRELAERMGAAAWLNPQAWPLRWPGGGR